MIWLTANILKRWRRCYRTAGSMSLPDTAHPLEKTDLEMLAEIVSAEFKLS